MKKTPIFLAAFAAILLLYSSHIARNYEALTYDLRFRLMGARPMSNDIVIIEISDDSLKNLGKWPLPRDFHASLIDVLTESGARQVVFDLLFSEPTLYDTLLAGSIKKAGNVYLSAAFDVRQGRARGLIYGAESTLSDPEAVFKASCRRFGHVNVLVDPDGKTRRVPLFIRYKDVVIPQLALVAASDYLGQDMQHLAASLPLADDGSFLVKYPAPWVDSFKHLSYFEVLKSYGQAKQGAKPDIDLSVLKGKVCFVGLTATGTSDIRPVPLENLYPMLGLQASVFNSLIKRDFLRDAGVPVNTLITFLLLLCSLFFCLRCAPRKAFIGNLALATGYTLLAFLIFRFAGIWISLFVPLAVVGMVFIVATSYRFFTEVKKRELLEKELTIARQIQQSFLPRQLDSLPGLSVATFLEPAKFVAGDLFDVFKVTNDRLGIFIGDVSGKGVPASLIMAQTILIFRIYNRLMHQPKDVLGILNRELCTKLEGRFVTALYMVADIREGVLRIASAGHGPLLLSRQDLVKDVEIEQGLPLGIVEETEYPQVSFKIADGDKFIVFTDGVTEARNPANTEFGIDALKKAIQQNRSLGAEALVARLKDMVNAFCAGSPQHDDITMIALEVKKEDT